jgi:hypothetical protein
MKSRLRILTLVVMFSAVLHAFQIRKSENSEIPKSTSSSSTMTHSTKLPHDFPVIEFRRYTVRDGEREHFATYFESYFPEAFQQLGAIAFGDFTEPQHPEHFTWMRGFHDMDERAKVNSAFYFGPVWKEHKATLNGLMTDSDNVLLLRPLRPDTQVPVFPAVDPVKEPQGAKGIVVAQIFQAKANQVDAVAASLEASFARYRDSGARDAGILVTLDVPNNFPQLPVRSDGPFLVWIGIVPNDEVLKKLTPIAEETAQSVQKLGTLQSAPELVVLRPNSRSRLRWITP